jgi:hypothetical protein
MRVPSAIVENFSSSLWLLTQTVLHSQVQAVENLAPQSLETLPWTNDEPSNQQQLASIFLTSLFLSVLSLKVAPLRWYKTIEGRRFEQNP